MPSNLLQAVTRRNLVTWYLLPLIHLNKVSFGPANFIESYVNKSGTIITVEVVSLELLPSQGCIHHDQLLGQKEVVKGYSSLQYRLPERWYLDFELFRDGKFSRFSKHAKTLIREYAGGSDSGEETDARLAALDKDKQLQLALEQELELVPGVLAGCELLPVPSANNYREA